jgi:N-acetylglucosamine-6-sulfatase
VRRVLLPILAAFALFGCGAEANRPAQLIGDPRQNVVLVLTDDLSTDMLRFMPNVQALMSQGVTFNRFIVSNSLCCPSRASLLTGLLPHNSRVFTNSPPLGGIKAFRKHGNDPRTFAVWLRDRGYRTALFGKYLNGYGAGNGGVPPGWTDWAASARAYQGFDYTLNVNGQPRQYGDRPEDYMTDVLADMGGRFLDRSTTDPSPFFLKLSTFTPHLPAIPAPRHVGLVPNARAPRTPAFNRPVADGPRWLDNRKRLGREAVQLIDARYRKRIRSVVSIDELVGTIRTRLAERGLDDQTVFIFTSDNGFHMGEHQLLPGKGTAFDTDIRVPLIAAGPGIPAGSTVDALVQNTDFAPTFAELAGLAPRSELDGRSLVPLMRGAGVPADWRTTALVEHRGRPADGKASDPDDQPRGAGNPPTYGALRLAEATYVAYETGEREFYDHVADPHQRRNVYSQLTPSERRALQRQLEAQLSCAGAAQCATATPLAQRAARAAASGLRRLRRR